MFEQKYYKISYTKQNLKTILDSSLQVTEKWTVYIKKKTIEMANGVKNLMVKDTILL